MTLHKTIKKNGIFVVSVLLDKRFSTSIGLIQSKEFVCPKKFITKKVVHR